jgi:uncharacterized circularly permuted ATP-grasp superfamily protein/uncharacterized alpha-E superfamily protein
MPSEADPASELILARDIAPRDEMADGRGGIKPHWRAIMATLFGLGRETLTRRATLLERAFAEEGITATLPGQAPTRWRCDLVPLPLPANEFTDLEAGLAQRAALLAAILADPMGLLDAGALPPDAVFPSRTFLRRYRTDAAPPPALTFYAADLLRDPDGGWRVLADHTDQAAGLGYALENRRLLSRVVPELFQSGKVLPPGPFLDRCAETLRALSSDEGAGVAILTHGHRDPLWFEHVLLAREMSLGLIEGGDLSARGGRVYLKTLRGPRPIGALWRRVPGDQVDPLELTPEGGTPGLLDAIRGGALRMVNDVGSAWLETPLLTAFLPRLAQHFLGAPLDLPSQATLWLGEPEAARTVLRDLDAWVIRSATDATTPPLRAGMMDPKAKDALVAAIVERPERFVASLPPLPSMAPCLGPAGLEPRPIALRLFLAFDGQRWHALPGGLARALSPEDALTGHLPRDALSKDVWVVTDEALASLGAAASAAPPLPIRRSAGDLPSRVADHFFWLKRYLERLEESARLQRAAITRLSRPSPSPREMHETLLLVRCLAAAGAVRAEDTTSLGGPLLAAAVLRGFRAEAGLPGGPRPLLTLVARQVDQLRDRLTDEVLATLTRFRIEITARLRDLKRDGDPGALEEATHLTARVLESSAAIAGLAAENMVRGGGRMFLDFGRRIERAQAILFQLAALLDQPLAASQAGRIEVALRLALELRDSVLTYHGRYLGVIQPAPALDLILADPANPRGLAFQLAEMRALLTGLDAEPEAALWEMIDSVGREVEQIITTVLTARDQGVAGAALPVRLRGLAGVIGRVSAQVSRRYFALLPLTRRVGIEAS